MRNSGSPGQMRKMRITRGNDRDSETTDLRHRMGDSIERILETSDIKMYKLLAH